MDPLSNEPDLIRRVAEGDQKAFLTLYDHYAPRVHALTVRILGNEMMAEEATQDTFLKFWSHARLYSSERGSFLVWLLTIARRTALDRLRMEARRPLLSDSKDPETIWPFLSDDKHDPEEARWRSLHFMIRDLPEEQRQVIELAYYQGMSQSEISDEMGWPLGTVKTRMRTGMEALRRAWLKDEH